MTEMELLASGYGLIEGPRVGRDDNLYFSDVHNGGVYRRRPSGAIETVIPKRRGVGGILFHADGGLVVGGRNVQHVETASSASSSSHPAAADSTTCTLTPPGASTWGRSAATHSRWKAPAQRVNAGGSRGRAKPSELYGDVGLSNGIGLSPDGRTLYQADTPRRQVIAHDIVDGRCVNRRAAVTLERGSPDGVAVDVDGGLWVAAYEGGCVAHYDVAGRLVEYIEVPARGVTSLCFGGADMRDLYVVTADNDRAELGGSIFRTRAPVAGVATPLVRL